MFARVAHLYSAKWALRPAGPQQRGAAGGAHLSVTAGDHRHLPRLLQANHAAGILAIRAGGWLRAKHTCEPRQAQCATDGRIVGRMGIEMLATNLQPRPPERDAADTPAPGAVNALTHAVCPLSVAQCSGVQPLLSVAAALAPPPEAL